MRLSAGGDSLSAKPIILAVVSDIHAGSTVALCPPDGPKLDDGGVYQPSKAQLWLWDCWLDFWNAVAVRRKKEKADLYCLYNGDIYDGDHHGTSQTVSRNPEAQAYIATEAFKIPQKLQPLRQFVVRGTEAHAGEAGSSEEGFAKGIGAERDTTTRTWSWWRLRLELNGVLFDVQHHGRMGQRPWTEGNVVNLLAAQIWHEHARVGLRHPDIAIRSHYHRHGDSGDAHPTRAIQTPAWQLKTAYAHRVAAESLAHVGGLFFTIMPDKQYDLTKKLYRGALPEIWRPA